MITALIWLGTLCIGVYVALILMYLLIIVCMFVVAIPLHLIDLHLKAERERAAKKVETTKDGFKID